jgi:hypothetical protein
VHYESTAFSAIVIISLAANLTVPINISIPGFISCGGLVCLGALILQNNIYYKKYSRSHALITTSIICITHLYQVPLVLARAEVPSQIKYDPDKSIEKYYLFEVNEMQHIAHPIPHRTLSVRGHWIRQCLWVHDVPSRH